jgi:glycosyltransferase involved in cell wall biosynthesis
MRLLLLTAYFPPDTGSAPHLFHELGRGLVRAGHEVTVVTTVPAYNVTAQHKKYAGRHHLTEQMDGMKVVRRSLRPRPSTPGVGRGWWQLATAVSLWSAARKLGPFDAALVLSPPLFLGLSAALLDTPFALNVQDLFPQSAIDLGVLKPGLVTSALQRIERYVYRRAAHITVHSEGNRSYIERTGVPAEKISVLRNWIDTDELRPGVRDNAFGRQHGLQSKFVVSFAGVLGISLGIDLLADVAHRLSNQPDIHFLVVGSGPAEKGLRMLLAESDVPNVTLLPMQPKESYPGILAASDASLVLLRSDVKTPVVPGKINSIMAAGRPVIASVPATGDAANLVREAQAGIVVPAGHAQALAEAILQLRSDPGLRERFGANGRRYSEMHLSLATAVAAVEALLRQVAGTRGTMG